MGSVLKHFPGYGSNKDTHIDSSFDERSYEEILSDALPPFISGIEEGAEAVMVSHNVVRSIDSENPSSLSSEINKLLREKLNFTGIIITDDVAMLALKDISDTSSKAIKAGSDLVITTDYVESFNAIKKALKDDVIDEERINHSVFRILAWKYYKKLMQ